MTTMLTPLADARSRLLQQFATRSPRPAEHVQLRGALGRVLSEEVTCPLDVPGFDNSQMDGYALRHRDLLLDAPLLVSQRVPAGGLAKPLQDGTCARIFTGAEIPAGADCVVMQELADPQDDGRVSFQRARHLGVGEAIRRRGADLAAGQLVLAAGHRIRGADLGLLASLGCSQVRVFSPLRVGVFSTGDELRQPGEPLGRGQIYDSNRPMLFGLLSRPDVELLDLGHLPDDLDATVSALRLAAQSADLVVTAGGVSVGEEDHVRHAVERLGRLDLWKLNLKPGKPFASGRLGLAEDAPVFVGLPGNPVSAWVTAVLMLLPMLDVLAGLPPVAAEARVKGLQAPSGFDWPRPDRREEFLRASLDPSGRLLLHPRQNSQILSSIVQSQGLVRIPPGQAVSVGDGLEFIPYTQLES